MFLRGYGSQNHTKNNGSQIGNTNTIHSSGNLNQIQGDATRKISGVINFRGTDGNSSGAGWTDENLFNVVKSNVSIYGVMINSTIARRTHYLDTGRVLPISTENRPVNVAVKYLIRVLN